MGREPLNMKYKIIKKARVRIETQTASLPVYVGKVTLLGWLLLVVYYEGAYYAGWTYQNLLDVLERANVPVLA